MGSKLSITSKQVSTSIIGIFVVAWGTMMLSMMIGTDELLQQAFSEINESTSFRLETDEGVTTGKLGKFFNCLNKHRSIYQIRSKTGEVVHAKLITSSTTYFEFSIVDNEAYRFYIVYAEEGLEAMNKQIFRRPKHSDSYAINCDMGLLNQLEK